MFFGPLVPAIFKLRPNRFLAIVETEGVKVECFVPNPGRLRELLQPDVRVYIKRVEGGVRRTAFDLALVEHRNTLVSVDSRVPNKLVEEAIEAGSIRVSRLCGRTPRAHLRGLSIRSPTYGRCQNGLTRSKVLHPRS